MTATNNTIRRRIIRVRRQIMALYSYLLLWLGVFSGMSLGLFQINTPHFAIFGCVLVINLVMCGLVISGALDRFREEHLTIFQISIGVALITVIIHYSYELEGGLLSLYFLAMMFGLFALSRKYLIITSLIILTAYTGHEIWHWYATPLNKFISLSIGHWFILLLGLIWFVYVGGHIFSLQESHRQQKRKLQEQRQALEARNNLLAEVAIRDSLTNLHNRRYLIEQLETEIARHEKSGMPLQLAIIDLDHFKAVNDAHGHHIGDTVLVTFAEHLRVFLRADDLVTRYGGEEFVIAFLNTPQDKAVLALRRLQTEFSKHEFVGSTLFNASFSAGISQSRKGDSASRLLQRADKALYKAKSQGRNLILIED